MLRCSSMRLASHVLRVKNVEMFKGQVFVVWIDLPAIKTCIQVEIDLQVYISARKVGFTGYIFFHILLFARWDAQVTWGLGDSHGDNYSLRFLYLILK